MWKDSIRNIVVIFQSTILRIVEFYVRRSATIIFPFWFLQFSLNIEVTSFCDNCQDQFSKDVVKISYCTCKIMATHSLHDCREFILASVTKPIYKQNHEND